MTSYRLPLGRAIDHPHPDRTAASHGPLFSDIRYQVWPNRQSMARSVRMQQRREPRQDDWRPLVKLTDTEGF